jgi:hypothetical protein
VGEERKFAQASTDEKKKEIQMIEGRQNGGLPTIRLSEIGRLRRKIGERGGVEENQKFGHSGLERVP